MNQRRIVLPVLLCILLAGCSIFDHNGKSNKSNEEKLEINRHIWQKRNVTNYQFNLFIGCYCAFEANPVIIVVSDDTVNAVLDPKTGKILTLPNSNRPASAKYANYPTVDKLFKTIEQAIKQNAYRLEVKYNPHYGYPEQINVNYGKNIADDYVHYQVTDFKLITPDI